MDDDIDRRGIVTGGHSPDKQVLAVTMRQAPTPAEEALWQNLRCNRCAGLHFRRQQVIDGFIADFYCHAAGLVVEVDGPIHEVQRDTDAQREAVLKARGLRILRFSNDDVCQRIAQVLATIAQVARKTYVHTGDPR